jgi:hypothetical protein
VPIEEVEEEEEDMEIFTASFKNHMKKIHSVRKTRVMNVKVCGKYFNRCVLKG